MESAERTFREFLAGAVSVGVSGACAAGALDGLTAGWVAGAVSVGVSGTCAAGALDGLTAGRTGGRAVF
ncbi:MAG TPA: hypothetical protein IAC44_01255 [Candidatus Merdimorpha stercoravium]|uniref:Lipoprotein n=1 Tax=Candidatus Merdimorpha stercoravium TaxID=2840863 RepID=A0A9D1KS39_9FLAO|nr:hypothetical protein [Candidatus Merdimorpha stercoravium]